MLARGRRFFSNLCMIFDISTRQMLHFTLVYWTNILNFNKLSVQSKIILKWKKYEKNSKTEVDNKIYFWRLSFWRFCLFGVATFGRLFCQIRLRSGPGSKFASFWNRKLFLTLFSFAYITIAFCLYRHDTIYRLNSRTEAIIKCHNITGCGAAKPVMMWRRLCQVIGFSRFRMQSLV